MFQLPFTSSKLYETRCFDSFLPNSKVEKISNFDAKTQVNPFVKNPRWLGAKIEIVVKGLVSLVTSPKPHETLFLIHFYHTKTSERFPILAQNHRLTYPFVKNPRWQPNKMETLLMGLQQFLFHYSKTSFNTIFSFFCQTKKQKKFPLLNMGC